MLQALRRSLQHLHREGFFATLKYRGGFCVSQSYMGVEEGGEI